jgi:hypothetical protein
LFAALDIATGQFIGEMHSAPSPAASSAFLRTIESQCAIELVVHLVMDQLRTHKDSSIKAGSLESAFPRSLHAPLGVVAEPVSRLFAHAHREVHPPRHGIVRLGNSESDPTYLDIPTPTSKPFAWVKSAGPTSRQHREILSANF